MRAIKDIAQYEDSDSELAKYTISQLQEKIDKAIETINKMICVGYTITNKGTSRNYMATGYNSEFGVRATELLDILKGGDK